MTHRDIKRTEKKFREVVIDVFNIYVREKMVCKVKYFKEGVNVRVFPRHYIFIFTRDVVKN